MTRPRERDGARNSVKVEKGIGPSPELRYGLHIRVGPRAWKTLGFLDNADSADRLAAATRACIRFAIKKDRAKRSKR